MTTQDKQNQYHTTKMLRKKEQIDKTIAQAKHNKGLILLITGNGKGKSTSAFGMIARSLGHAMKVGVCQFIKNRSDTGEEAFFKTQKNCEWHVLGDGFTWDTQDKNQDIKTAQKGWQIAEKMLTDDSYDLVILDELTYLLSYQYLDKKTVLNNLKNKPKKQHIIITGRSAIAELKDISDTVSEIKDLKHAYKAGIQAQKGIDF
jgi:cob(I)alamin adenosyltransferase